MTTSTSFRRIIIADISDLSGLARRRPACRRRAEPI